MGVRVSFAWVGGGVFGDASGFRANVRIPDIERTLGSKIQ
jgi:hypothetical protein